MKEKHEHITSQHPPTEVLARGRLIIRTHGFEPLQWEHMVLQYVEKHGEISRAEVAELCHISGPQAYRLLKKLEREGHLTPIGTKGRSVKYERRIGENAR